MTTKDAAVTRFNEVVVTCRRILAAGAGEFDEEVVLAVGGESLTIWGRPASVYLRINDDYYAVISAKNAALRKRAGTKPLKYVDDCVRESFFPEGAPVMTENLQAGENI